MEFNFNQLQNSTPRNYIWCRHIKAYLKFCNDAASKFTEEVMAACGYAKASKFTRHSAAWINLEKSIPLQFLESIEVDQSILEEALRLDQKEYNKAVNVLPVPAQYSLKFFSGMYILKSFEGQETVYDCIEYLQPLLDVWNNRNAQAFITWPHLKTIWMRPHKEFSETYYSPRYYHEKGQVNFCSQKRMPGTMRIG